MWGLNESSLAAIEKTRAEVEASQEQKEAILGTKADLERGRPQGVVPRLPAARLP